MKKISLRTKAEVIGITMLLVAIGSMSVMSTYLSYSGPNGSYAWTSTDQSFIICSNGNRYNATFAGLTTAFAIGGDITIPVCNITFTGALSPSNNSWIHGQGGNRSIFWLGNNVNTNMINLNSRHNVRIEGIFLDMNNRSQNQITGNNISIIDFTGSTTNKAKNNTITNCELCNGMTKSIIDIEENTEYNTVSFCNIHNRRWYHGVNWGYGAGIFLSGNHNNILYNNIRDTYACGVATEANLGAPPTRDSLIEGNDISGTISYGIYMEGPGSGTCDKSNNNTVALNRIHDLYSDCYSTTDASPPVSYGTGIMCSPGSIVNANRIFHVPTTGIKVIQYHGNVSTVVTTVISNNLITDIYGAGGFGIWLSNSAFTTSVLINGNIIDGVLLGNGTRVPSTSDNVTISNTHYINCVQGIINSGSRLSVIGCEFRNMARYGIESSTTKETNIKDCSFVNIKGTYGIYTVGPVSIEDCYLNATAYYAIYISSGNYNQVIGCTIDDYGLSGNGDGIHSHNCVNSTYSLNTILKGGVGGTSDGIELDDGHNCTVIGNIISFSDNGIKESGAPDGNIILGNSITSCTTKVTIVGVRSYEMLVNTTTGLVGIHSGLGTYWH